MQRAEYESWKPVDVARLLALVESERRYFQELLAKLPVAVAVVSAAGELRAANRAFRDTFGLAAEDVARTSVTGLFAEAPVADWVREVAETGASLGECEVLTGEGESARHFHLRMDPAPEWTHGEQREVLLTVLEAAGEAEGEAEEQESVPEPGEKPQPSRPAPDPAQQVERAKRAALERLASRVAHVANNLLMIIGGYGEEILESLPEGDVRRAGMAEILRAAERLGRLTRDLNALTAPREYEAASVPLEAWMREAAARLEEFHVVAEPPAPGLCAQASPELLEEIVIEAARYLRPMLGETGRLRLAALALDSERVQLRLEWPGAQIREEARERFFEPFAGEKAGTDPPLGLAGLVKSWEKLGGSMRLEGDALVIECPRAPDAAAEEEAVLLVEDEPGIRSLVARALERAGYAVVQAGSAQEALELWQDRRHAPAVLVTDLTMPGISGKELAERMRIRFPELRVLFVSGYASEEDLPGRADGAGRDEKTQFLHKPFTTQRLLELIRQLDAR
ncbi:MAG: response regulator [Bryobacteraceae bacterium]|nr:response regulator [Bryobacteraceae bacterium]